MELKQRNKEDYCPFPDRNCEDCFFYWLDGCVLEMVKQSLMGLVRRRHFE